MLDYTPKPWEIEGEIVEWTPRRRSNWTSGARIMAGDRVVIEGGSDGFSDDAVGILREPDAQIIKIAPDIYEAITMDPRVNDVTGQELLIYIAAHLEYERLDVWAAFLRKRAEAERAALARIGGEGET